MLAGARRFFRPPTWVQETKHLSHPLLLPWACQQGAGWEEGQSGLELVPSGILALQEVVLFAMPAPLTLF